MEGWCKSDCTGAELGWYCTGGTTTSASLCLTECGDGILVSILEECDDENSNDSDGCSSQCKIEQFYNCIWTN